MTKKNNNMKINLLFFLVLFFSIATTTAIESKHSEDKILIEFLSSIKTKNNEMVNFNSQNDYYDEKKADYQAVFLDKNDVFGGVVYDGEMFVISISKKFWDLKFTESEKVRLIQVNHSYNQLLEVYDKLVAYIESSQTERTLEMYINEKENNIVISGKTPIDVKDLKMFYEKLKTNQTDAPSVVFSINKDLFNEIPTLSAGQKILAPDTCSMGYSAFLSGRYGFVTAGHCTNGPGKVVKTGSGTIIGKTIAHSTSTDSAFVHLDYGYSMDRYSRASTGQSHMYSKVDSSVAYVGATLIINSINGHMQSQITTLNKYVSYHNDGYDYSVKDAIGINKPLVSGTSGAAALQYYDGKYNVVGIAISTSVSSGTISKARNINNALGITYAPAP